MSTRPRRPWTSNKVAAGQPGHSGPGVAFITRTRNPGRIVGVDTRYLDPTINGGVKLRRLPGDSSTDPWYLDLQGLTRACTVVITESAIDAMSVESSGLPATAGLAVRSIANATRIDWRWLRGKRVLIGFDNDEPDQRNRRAGPEAAWALHERLSAQSHEFGLARDLITEMNTHIQETSAEREPWVWITEILLAEIASGAYRHPFLYRTEGNGRDVLLVRTRHVMHHLRSSPGLKETWNGLPVKSDRVYKRQLKEAGVLHRERVDASINGARECHLVALDLGRLEEYGLHTGRPEETGL